MQATTWIYIAITTLSIQATAPVAPTDPLRATREPSAAKLPKLTSMIPVPDRNVLDSRAIRSVVRSRRRSVAMCYEQSLRRDQALAGRVAFVITVVPSGRVSEARLITKAHAGTAMAGCIEKKLKTWRFPRFSGEAQDVLLPFRLQRR